MKFVCLKLLAVGAIAACAPSTPIPPVDDRCTGAGVICTWAGTGAAGFDGDGIPLAESRLYWPIDVSFTSSGTYVLDWNNHKVRRVTDDGTFDTVIGTDFIGDGPDDLSDLEAPGAPGIDVNLNHPTQIEELADGTLLLLSWHNSKLRHYDPTTGLAYVLSGRGSGFAGDGGPIADARFSQPSGAAIDVDGNIYVLDQRNQRVRKIDNAGTINTVVGTGVAGFSGDGAAPALAQLNLPAGPNPQPGGGLLLDEQGHLYISDSLNHRIRRVDFDADIIETIAGTGTAGFAGDEGPALAAELNFPRDLAFGPDARLYFTDVLNNRVRAVDLDTGSIVTVAGNGVHGFDADGVLATEAALQEPGGITFDAEGNLYIADTYNHRVRRVAAEQR